MNEETIRHYWYSQKAVLYEIVKQAQYKEVIFLDKTHERLPVRCIFLFKVEQLLKNFEVFRFMNSNYIIYLSVAYFKNAPIFSFNPFLRKEQIYRWSKEEEYKDYWNGYDMFFDFDSNDPFDIKLALKDTAKLKNILDHYQIPYSIRFSGTKGFHVLIPYEVLPQINLKTVQFCKIFAENLKRKLNLDTLDIGVFDERRIFKVAYSFDKGNVCLPLDEEQFINFDINSISALKVLDKIKIFNRGILMRHTNFSIEQKRSHFLELLKEIKK